MELTLEQEWSVREATRPVPRPSNLNSDLNSSLKTTLHMLSCTQRRCEHLGTTGDRSPADIEAE